jgi:creatinine amidohydrolase/Fe(II)-dependent formamide hydrolase-like protein
LRQLPPDTQFVLPICSLATPYDELARLGDYLLPPLFQEALDESLEQRIVERIAQCFPVYGEPAANRRRLRIVRLPPQTLPLRPPPRVLAFSVDTAVEEHGPHLPLATDTIQSYRVLRALGDSIDGLELARPLDYGQLTWGLPFGFSIDITAELLTAYVRGYANALSSWRAPQALYVVDVHGSIVHRQAIVQGLQDSHVERWSFRWLHEPLVEFAGDRGDQHAGGVETALIELAGTALLDRDWWPQREAELADRQMSLREAVALSSDLAAFVAFVRTQQGNGIVGQIGNYHRVDAPRMFDRMCQLARQDVAALKSEG